MPGEIMEGLITPSLAEIMEGLAGAALGEDNLRAVRDRAMLLGQEDVILHLVQNDDVDVEIEPEEEEDDDDEEEEEEEEEPSDCDSSCEIGDCQNETGILKEEEQLKKNSFGVLEYGCTHYRRRCQIRAPCCGEVYDCRHCHNEVKNANEPIPEKRHDLPRHLVESVICSICSTEQEVQQMCKNCGVSMGEYFCVKCKFFDDDVKKGQYHCDGCGICRVGGSDNFFHCQRCGCCYSKVLQSGHPCVEKSMHQNCPVCFEYLFDSIKDISVMLCGHTLHKECWDEMRKHSQYTCPMCSKSTVDMTENWKLLDQEIAATPMPEAYQNKMVWILCNDCGVTSKVSFHIIAHKCANCSSYNTRQTAGRPDQEHPGTPVNIRL